MTLQFGEVVLIRIQATGAKVRPAVVLLDSGDDDFVAAPIKSQVRTTIGRSKIGEQWDSMRAVALINCRAFCHGRSR